MLTIAYITCREDPKIGWFFDSLKRQILPEDEIEVVVVSHYELSWLNPPIYDGVTFTKPKPTVWQGEYRLTARNYFAPSNSRNTAICLAPDGWIAFVDDLSVLLPGWLSAVREAMKGKKIILGAYKKMKNLFVENGEAQSFTEFQAGLDSRWNSGRIEGPVPAAGGWLFGCSFAAPVEALLKVNGLDENCDSCGGEDYCLGIRLENAGYEFIYDLRMLTYESEEHHYIGEPFIRMDKGKSPKDKSHALLNMALKSKYAPNYFGEGGIRSLREKILRGQSFPIPQIPDRDFFDGQKLSEM